MIPRTAPITLSVVFLASLDPTIHLKENIRALGVGGDEQSSVSCEEARNFLRRVRVTRRVRARMSRLRDVFTDDISP